MRTAIVRNGKVLNIIEAEPGFTIPGETLVPLAGHPPVDKGDLWDGSSFSKPPKPQPSPVDIRLAALKALIAQGNASLQEVQEYLALRDGL